MQRVGLSHCPDRSATLQRSGLQRDATIAAGDNGRSCLRNAGAAVELPAPRLKLPAMASGAQLPVLGIAAAHASACE